MSQKMFIKIICVVLTVTLLSGNLRVLATSSPPTDWQSGFRSDQVNTPTSPTATSMQVAAGAAHSCAVINGAAYCWGDNSSGQLGDGTTIDRSTPTSVSGLTSGVIAIAAGHDHTCALTFSGVRCWGWNGYGQLGDGTNTDRLTPVEVSGLTSGVTAITAGSYHTCALSAAGAVKCWGWNDSGQVGDGTTTTRWTAVDVSGLASGVSTIDAGSGHTCAVMAAGGVKCWGYNSAGQVGDGSTTTRLSPIDVSGLSSGVSSIIAGGSHSCAVIASAVKCWGLNDSGQVGDGTTTTRLTPVDVNGLIGSANKITAGGEHTCALMTNGGVKCWGDNLLGQLGNGNTLDSAIPVAAVGMTSGVISLGAGGSHTCAVQASGGVKCWGGNQKGQLGDGTTINHPWPILTLGLWPGTVSIAAGGYHTCALSGSGGVRCWGSNRYGQLGDNTSTNRARPTPVIGLSTVIIAIAAGDNHTCALTSSGGVKCWGDNSSGQLGDGSYYARWTPVDVFGLTSGVLAITAGSFHTCALVTNGVVKCWGLNLSGQLGDGSKTNRYTPGDVQLGFMAADLAAGDDHTCAVLAGSGGVRCWGENISGQLGDGTYSSGKPLPTDVVGLNTGAASLTGGTSHTCAVTMGGGLKCWGANNLGQLGDGTNIGRSTLVDVAGFTSGASAISAGWAHTCTLTANGAVTCWGSNSYGELGDGSGNHQLLPVPVAGLSSGVTAVTAGQSHTCALTSAGQVLCWGRNSEGQLGVGTTTSHIVTPVPVNTSGLIGIAAGGGHSCAVTDSGGVQCWGYNYHGQLGDGTTTSRTIPVNVSGVTSYAIAVAVGNFHTCALVIPGRVKCWGDNQYGQLGDGTTTHSLTPVDVTGLASDVVVAITTGSEHTCALLDMGNVKCWGSNGSGQLGDGTTTDRLTPVNVGGLSGGVTSIASSSISGHTCAVTNSGGVKCWGRNWDGQLGDGTRTDRTTPVDVSGLPTGAIGMATGYGHSCALTASGGVKCWGSNEYGQLGDGTQTNSFVPVEVSGLTTGVSAITAGYYHSCALTSVGGVKCWGFNLHGQLGDGTNTYRTTPVDVNGLTGGVIALSAGGNHTLALTASGIIQTVMAQVSVQAQTQSPATGGGVLAWGANDQGQLGDGTFTDRLTPVMVIGLSGGFVALAAGEYHTCGLTASGGVKCWGFNLHGQLGDGTTSDRLTPVDVSGLTGGVIAIDAGKNHTCALTSATGVKCWGWNVSGEIGNGTTAQQNTPVDVSGLTGGVAAITAGDAHTCAILIAGGGVRCWGFNWGGQLGDGTKTDRTTPVDVSGLTSEAVAVSGGGLHTCVLTAIGGVMCWGTNLVGQLGDGTTTDRLTPVNVSGLMGGVSAVEAGAMHTCIILLSGGVLCWGNNNDGQLGDGSSTNIRPSPVEVLGLQGGVIALASGHAHTCALTDLYQVKCWGWNLFGQLGDGTTTSRPLPVDVNGLPAEVNAIAAGSSHTVALMTPNPSSNTAQFVQSPAALPSGDPRWFSWGANAYGQLGDGTTIDRLTPVAVLLGSLQSLFLPLVVR